jgi:hypothetical protein
MAGLSDRSPNFTRLRHLRSLDERIYAMPMSEDVAKQSQVATSLDTGLPRSEAISGVQVPQAYQ